MRIGVFGMGFTGRRIAALGAGAGGSVRAFSARTVPPGGVALDARQPDAPQVLDRLLAADALDAAIVTFPPEGVPGAWWEVLARKARRVILLGTTGIHAHSGGRREPLDESSPLIPGHPRGPAEARVAALGGTVLRLAGLYGPGRNPAEWVRAGRIAPEDRQINLVHGDDAAAAALALGAHPAPRPVYLLADGQEHTAARVVALATALGWGPPPGVEPPRRSGDAVVRNAAFLADVPGFRFRDFRVELDRLCRGTG